MLHSSTNRVDCKLRRATKFANFILKKDLNSPAAKRKIKAKDDKMLALEQYFESCGRDLSRTLS